MARQKKHAFQDGGGGGKATGGKTPKKVFIMVTSRVGVLMYGGAAARVDVGNQATSSHVGR